MSDGWTEIPGGARAGRAAEDRGQGRPGPDEPVSGDSLVSHALSACCAGHWGHRRTPQTRPALREPLSLGDSELSRGHRSPVTSWGAGRLRQKHLPVWRRGLGHVGARSGRALQAGHSQAKARTWELIGVPEAARR